MSKSTLWESGLISLVFMNFDFPGVGDAGGLRGSVASGGLWISLHTADPGEAGDQTTNEVTYGSYSRMIVMRDSVQWNPQFNWPTNFPKGTSGSEVATYLGIGTSESGAGKLLYRAQLAAPLNCGLGIIPRITYGSVTES